MAFPSDEWGNHHLKGEATILQGEATILQGEEWHHSSPCSLMCLQTLQLWGGALWPALTRPPRVGGGRLIYIPRSESPTRPPLLSPSLPETGSQKPFIVGQVIYFNSINFFVAFSWLGIFLIPCAFIEGVKFCHLGPGRLIYDWGPVMDWIGVACLIASTKELPRTYQKEVFRCIQRWFSWAPTTTCMLTVSPYVYLWCTNYLCSICAYWCSTSSVIYKHWQAQCIIAHEKTTVIILKILQK